ncbi:MAG: alpha/beta hydrolase family protein, partial [Planctomycetota bacterium]
VRWMPDQSRVLVLAVVHCRAPARPADPRGPIVQETRRGGTAQERTYQDLLQDPHDEDLFEHYGKSRLCIVDPATGTLDVVGKPRLYARVAPSPDGTLLLAEYLERPFSYLVPHYRFPRRTVVLGRDGTLRRELHQSRLAEAIPIGGVARGPRRVRWLATGQHALHWIEALDGGDPNVDAPLRDQTFLLLEPDAVPRLWFKSQFRQQSIACTSDGRWVMTSEVDRKSRTERMWLRDLQAVAEPGKMLWERSMQDAYSDPGDAVSERTVDGRAVLRSRNGKVFFAGEGAQPSGSRPFVETLSLAAAGADGERERQRVFESAPQRYERLIGFAGDGSSPSLVVRSESRKQAPRIELVDLATDKRRVLHEQQDPGAEWIANIQKRLVRYQREDGVPMNGTLYLPPSYRDGDQLPCLLWAYPREYVNASDAGQVRAAPDRYLRLSGSSHLFLLLEGYAVFDRASMPIVGPRRSANDTFVEQVRMNARAAIAALGAEGCIDTKRCAVGGHSYGAFMTANLLAHSDLFCCGIARSGAYNRTLTPFGFQNEERTYWQAPDIYFAMSPFMHADKVDEPLLLLHGADDNNSGTFPIQSKRFFAAIKGHGGTARLCFLPHESHGYRGRQSVLHCLREMIDWLDLHGKRPR